MKDTYTLGLSPEEIEFIIGAVTQAASEVACQYSEVHQLVSNILDKMPEYDVPTFH